MEAIDQLSYTSDTIPESIPEAAGDAAVSPGAASRLSGRLLFSVAKPVSTERLTLCSRGACLRNAPKMGDTKIDEGHREEQPTEVLGASGVC